MDAEQYTAICDDILRRRRERELREAKKEERRERIKSRNQKLTKDSILVQKLTTGFLLRASDDFMSVINAAAAEEGRTVSNWIRSSLMRYVESQTYFDKILTKVEKGG